MSSPTPELDPGERSAQRRPSVGESVRRAFIKGLALTIPAIITLVVLTFALEFVASLLAPVVAATNFLWPNQDVPAAVIQVVAVVVLLGLVLVVGLVSDRTTGDHLAEEFHSFMASIPGVGSVYTSFNEMSELMLNSDTDSFQEVKLVEYPTDNSYAVAFLTAETPDVVNDATSHEDMQTLFMPMAPNPVMGGFVVHVDEDQVYDVDLTVEEGIRSIVTSGVAIGDDGAHAGELDERGRRQLGAYGQPGRRAAPGMDGYPDTLDDEDRES